MLRHIDRKRAALNLKPLMYKQAFDLATGRCLVDPDVSLPVWPVRVMDGVVALGDQTRGTLRDAPNEFAQQGAA